MMQIECKGRVLIVEDQARYRVELEKMFAPLGFVVKSAQGEEEELLGSARQMVLEFRPHVTIMDLELLVKPPHRKDRSGLTLIDEPDFAFTRCVVYTAHLGSDHTLTRELKEKQNVDDVIARHEVERLEAAVLNSFRRLCACRTDYHVTWPVAWSPLRITEALFGAGSGVPPDIIVDVIGRLFPRGAPLLTLSTLEGAAATTSVARGHSVLLRASMGRMPFVIKLAPRDRIATEVDAYEQYIDDRLAGSYHVQSKGSSVFWDVGAIHYSFLGSPQYPIPSLAAFYRGEPDPAAILPPLRHFFEEVWRPHYTETRARIRESLFDAYDRALSLRRRLHEFRDVSYSAINGAPPQLPDPVAWVLEHEADSALDSYQAVTHGDLHADNLFIDAGHAWAIDFERTGPGPILRDFVELEQDIVTRLLPLDEEGVNEFFQFALALTAPRTPSNPLRLPEPLRPSAEFTKAAEVIAGLRKMAANVTHFMDMREYYWGLLLDALLGSSLAQKDSPQGNRSMLLAAVIANRLENWNEQWPPDWARWHRWDERRNDDTLSSERDLVFFSYSHKDAEWLDRVQTMLKPLVRGKKISTWSDKGIGVGQTWRAELDSALYRAKVAVLLVSANFLASDFIADNELPPLLEAADKKGTKIVWIPVGACLYKETELERYQAAHDPNKPLEGLSEAERSQALVKICEIIKTMASTP
jgi:hypothetical protein